MQLWSVRIYWHLVLLSPINNNWHGCPDLAEKTDLSSNYTGLYIGGYFIMHCGFVLLIWVHRRVHG